MEIYLDMYQTITVAVFVLMLGKVLKKKFGILERFCIPAPVIGGVVFAVFTCICYVTGIAEFSFDDILKEVCMVFFFTSVGFQANLKVLKSGGKALIIFLGLVIGLILSQNFLAVGLAKLLHISPLVGLCTGSIPMVGGHGTAGAFGPVLDSFSFVMEYCQKNGIMDKAQEINDTINRLRAIQNNSIGVITLAEDLDIDSVTEIFIRINSKGVVLSQADFAMSKISSNEIYNGNVTRKTIDYFCHLLESPEDLKEIKKNDAEFAARPEFEAIKWAAAKNATIYRTCYTDILRVAFTYKFKRGKLADLVSLLSGRDFETREFKIEIEERSFNQLHEAVLQAVNQTNYERYLMIVRSAGIVKKSLIRSQNVLNFGYALFLALRERKVDSNQIEKIVRKWLALSILTGRYSSGSPESAFDYDIKRFFAYDDPMQYLNITEAGELSEAYWKVNLVQRLNTSVASSPYFNMFLVAQVKAHDKGLLSMEIDIESMLENRGDIHHLFPKNYLIKNGIVQAQYNQIANYAFIQQEINIKIKDSSPAHYMTEVIGQCNTKKPVYGGIIEQDRLAENLKQNCIPDGFESMEIGDYQDFLQRRRELMAEKIHQYYDSL